MALAENGASVNPIDQPLHDEEHPFCFADPTCECHENEEAIAQVYLAVQDGLMTPEEATDFVLGKLL